MDLIYSESYFFYISHSPYQFISTIKHAYTIVQCATSPKTQQTNITWYSAITVSSIVDDIQKHKYKCYKYSGGTGKTDRVQLVVM